MVVGGKRWAKGGVPSPLGFGQGGKRLANSTPQLHRVPEQHLKQYDSTSTSTGTQAQAHRHRHGHLEETETEALARPHVLADETDDLGEAGHSTHATTTAGRCLNHGVACTCKQACTPTHPRRGVCWEHIINNQQTRGAIAMPTSHNTHNTRAHTPATLQRSIILRSEFCHDNANVDTGGRRVHVGGANRRRPSST